MISIVLFLFELFTLEPAKVRQGLNRNWYIHYGLTLKSFRIWYKSLPSHTEPPQKAKGESESSQIIIAVPHTIIHLISITMNFSTSALLLIVAAGSGTGTVSETFYT